MKPVCDLHTILEMDIVEVWRNYLAAMDVWVDFQKREAASGKVVGADRYRMFLYREVAKRSLDVYHCRIEEELW